MDIANSLKELDISPNDNQDITYEFVDVFKNPNNLPINQIHLERSWYELRKDLSKGIDFSQLSNKEFEQKYCEKKSEIIPALDKRWLPKCVLQKFEPYVFTLSQQENINFLTNNIQFIDSLDYLLKCNYHQFWCTILFEPSATVALRSFILNPVPWYQANYLEDEYAQMYKTVFNKFLLVYERLLTFKKSQTEYMPEGYGFKKLIDKKLINLPIVMTLTFLYKSSNLNFVNKLTSLYFNDTSQLDFQIKEVEELINQTLIVLEMIGGHVCGFDKDAKIVPIAVTKRPTVFDMTWVYSVVNYLLNTVCMVHTLLEFYKPAIEICLDKKFPFRIPYTYVNVYRDLYELLFEREELKVQENLTQKVLEEINLGRTELIDVYHVFISHCLDKALDNMGDTKQQEQIVEMYLKLMSTALEDEYFICDYNIKYNVASQNEMFESCCPLDTTRTEFIVSCINKFPRQTKLHQLSALRKEKLEDIFKKFKPPEIEIEEEEPQAGPSNEQPLKDDEIEIKVKDIMDMFPHLGDGFVLQCLEAYDYNSSDVINAILEENLPPHLYVIPFDSIRIPPEPEPEKPVLAYKGKKPDYDDALKLLNDKKDVKQLKTFVLEGIHYTNDYLYDDEYDDRYDDDVPIKVADNPLEEEFLTSNPNHEELASDTSYSDEEFDDNGKPINKTEMNGRGTSSQADRRNFCEDPALVRERREASYRSRQGYRKPPSKTTPDVVGKAKGQGQEKNVLKAREKKNVNKSSRANHNRKSGAQFKRNKGMIPS